MKYRIRNFRWDGAALDEEAVLSIVARELGVRIERIAGLRVLKRSLDARRLHRQVRHAFTLEVDLHDRPTRIPRGFVLEEVPLAAVPAIRAGEAAKGLRATVVGSGPAGLFAALALSRQGAKVTLCEQGPPLADRVRSVARLWREGVLDPGSNVQFGAGGAGTFSDGKLTARSKDPRARTVLEVLVECGGNPSILDEACPHLGTDGIRALFARFAARLGEAGVTIQYGARVGSPRPRGGGWAFKVGGEERQADWLLLAPGHSARGLLKDLISAGVPFRAKGFAVGVRIEHPQAWLDRRQYRGRAGAESLPPASYRLAFKDGGTRRGVYSFCVCPGGLVVNASSEEGGIVTNGMSLSSKSSGFANGGLVVTVAPEDVEENCLRALEFQGELERRAFGMGGGGFVAPAQTARAFLEDRTDLSLPRCTYRPGVRASRLSDLFPEWVAGPLARGLLDFDAKLPGFVDRGLLVAPETRTSSPLQAVRCPDGCAEGFPGLYLLGEGSGWAGGIVSSAVDALRIVDLALG